MSITKNTAGSSHNLVTDSIVEPTVFDDYAQEYFLDAFETLRTRIQRNPSLTPQPHYDANIATILLGHVHATQRSVVAEVNTEDGKLCINTAIGTDINPYAQHISANFNELSQTTHLPAFHAVAVMTGETNTHFLEAFVCYLFVAAGYRNTLETFRSGYFRDFEVACRLFHAHQDGINFDVKGRVELYRMADRVIDSDNLQEEFKPTTLPGNSGSLGSRAASFDPHSQLSSEQTRAEKMGSRFGAKIDSALVRKGVQDGELDDGSNNNIGPNLFQAQKLREKPEEVRKESEHWKTMFKYQKENAQSWRKAWLDQRISHNSAMSDLLDKQSEILENASQWKRRSEDNEALANSRKIACDHSDTESQNMRLEVVEYKKASVEAKEDVLSHSSFLGLSGIGIDSRDGEGSILSICCSV
jgi:hypothetical protein